MGAGRFSGDPTGDPAGVPCDPELWSEESKRSVEYEFVPPRPYRDKAYLCWRCKAPDVFTAAEQKHTYEVQKANISQQRVLCRECHREWVALERQVGECRRRWAAERSVLIYDPAFLRRWLAALEALPRYGRPRDEGNIAMLSRLVADEQKPDEPAAESGRQ
jgi:hypothetical protein